jgi:thymidylate synthase (FAD)
MTLWTEVQDSDKYVKVLDLGFVGLVDVMGDDSAIVQAARTSYGKGTKSVSEDRGLIRYLMKNFHTSVFEMVEFKFHIKLPIFVMRQHVRHRTANLNEYSGRYSVMTDEFYIPEPHRLQSQSVLNKQGSGAQLGGAELEAVHDLIKHMSTESYKSYLALINDPQSEDYWPIDGRQGLSRELSRIILPQNNYTECYWKIDLKNLLHYIRLRADSHAQWEIQEFARALALYVKQRCPIAFEAFEDYMEQCKTISRLDLNLMQAVIQTSNHLGVGFTSAYNWMQLQEGGREAVRLKHGLNKRELTEFEAQWQLTS